MLFPWLSFTSSWVQWTMKLVRVVLYSSHPISHYATPHASTDHSKKKFSLKCNASIIKAGCWNANRIQYNFGGVGRNVPMTFLFCCWVESLVPFMDMRKRVYIYMAYYKMPTKRNLFADNSVASSQCPLKMKCFHVDLIRPRNFYLLFFSIPSSIGMWVGGIKVPNSKFFWEHVQLSLSLCNEKKGMRRRKRKSFNFLMKNARHSLDKLEGHSQSDFLLLTKKLPACVEVKDWCWQVSQRMCRKLYSLMIQKCIFIGYSHSST